MKKQLSTKKHGFTIIEVVLVLAIAGLIFLMVFVALPALQRSQRDTQRRNDMSRMATAITNWQTNHNNALPSSSDKSTFLSEYLKSNSDLTKSEFKDPEGTNYDLTIGAYGSNFNSADDRPMIRLITKAYCNGETVVGGSSSDAAVGNYAIVYKLEGSGTVCLDNK